MDDLNKQVQEAIDELVASRAERGMQVAVYRHGQQVVDAVAGVADELYFAVPASELGRQARLQDAEGAAEMLAAMPDDSPSSGWVASAAAGHTPTPPPGSVPRCSGTASTPTSASPSGSSGSSARPPERPGAAIAALTR